eukprot:GFUD01003592.1.p1 GENE.GFUD01003592.1~~GFUD01003592.1.p1  ORF type:complete len:156 (+),score=66.06 GFUD01003592.1:457-924(+)
MTESEEFPEELSDTVKNFHGSLGDLKTKLDLMLSQPRTDLYDKLDPMGKAKMDLVSAYAINSLFWMLLKTMGENPGAADVKKELDRVKEAMMRCKEIQDRAKRGRVDQGAAKRLVSSGLWEPGKSKIRPVAGDGSEVGHGDEQELPRKKIKQFDV